MGQECLSNGQRQLGKPVLRRSNALPAAVFTLDTTLHIPVILYADQFREKRRLVVPAFSGDGSALRYDGKLFFQEGH